MNIAIIGKGNVGSALEAGLSREGHQVHAVGRDPDAIREAGEFAELVILAVPFNEINTAVSELGSSLSGKVVVDATNALTPEYELAVGFTTSGAEELQNKLPDSKVVKAFNTAFASTMTTGRIGDEQLAGLVAADDADAKNTVLDLVRQLGFDPIDAGPLASARLLEPLAVLNIKLGFVQGYGPNSGFRLVH
jgi:8-hydroxy-5-deazaflavin:NADPH oxidoreductase